MRVEAHQPGRRAAALSGACAPTAPGTLTLIYFNVKGDYLARLLPVGAERVVSGRVEFYNRVAADRRTPISCCGPTSSTG